MEMNFYFEVRRSTLERLEEPYVTMDSERLFPEQPPSLSIEQQAIYEGTVEIILFRSGARKRKLEFILDLRDLEWIKMKLSENGGDCMLGLYNSRDIPILQDEASAMPAMFFGNIAWLTDKLIPKVTPGKITKGIRRMPLPPFLNFVAQYFTKAV